MNGTDRHLETDNSTNEELLVRIAEEAAEIIQSVTKMLRFGIHGNHPTYYNGRSNVEHFDDETKQFIHILNVWYDRRRVEEEQARLSGT